MRVDVDDAKTCAFACETQSGRASDTLGSARDEHDSPFQACLHDVSIQCSVVCERSGTRCHFHSLSNSAVIRRTYRLSTRLMKGLISTVAQIPALLNGSASTNF